MPRRRRGQNESAARPPGPRPVKLPPALHEKLAIVATFRGQRTNHYLAQLITPLVEREFAEVIRLAAKGLPS